MFIIKKVKHPHFVTLDYSDIDDTLLPRELQHWIKEVFFSAPCHEAVCVWLDNKLVGVFRYNIFDDYLESEGTVVLSKYRKQGLAQQMWAKLFQSTSINQVYASAVTTAGYNFLACIAKQYPYIQWYIEDLVA